MRALSKGDHVITKITLPRLSLKVTCGCEGTGRAASAVDADRVSGRKIPSAPYTTHASPF